MAYRLDKNQLLDTLEGWNHVLKRKIHLIACGGTAMTLLGVKPSTKDVNFMVPEVTEYEYLTQRLRALGYKQVTGFGWERPGENFQFDLFRGNRIHTTELLESPLGTGRNTILIEYSHLYIGILNEYDLISSKLMRGARVDFEDCITLVAANKTKIDLNRLTEHFYAMVIYDVAEDRLKPNIERFLELLRENKLYGG